MKRFLSLLLAFILVLTLFAGCKPKEQQPLTICIDIIDLLVVGSNSDKEVASVQLQRESSAAELFRQTIKDRGGPEDVEFEFIPASGQERDAAISRIRTELISGRGPDVFIVNCANDNQLQALLPSPRAVMDLSLFLPLDEYIEKAQYMEWDKLEPAVMAAGKNNEGQQLLPLTYTFPVSICKKEDVTFDLSPDTTFYDMLEGGSDFASFALANQFYRYIWSDYAFSQVADFTTEELQFTQDDLLKWENAQQEWYDRAAAGEFDSALSRYSISMNVKFNEANSSSYQEFKKEVQGSELALVPMYSTQGGVTATVLSYAGINRNTKRPDDAFRVLDALLDREVQQYSDIYKMLTEMRAIPVHQDLMQGDYPVAGWTMDDDLYQAYRTVKEQITTAKFRSVYEDELFALDRECWGEDTDIEQAVARAYTTMKMILAES